MRQLTCVGVLLFVLVAWAPQLSASVGDAAEPVAGREEAELGFDEAIELLRASQAESRQILIDILGTALELGMLGKDAEPDEMTRRIAEGVHGDVPARLQNNRQQVIRATRRILREQDPDRLEAGLLAMSSEELAAVLSRIVPEAQPDQIETLSEGSPRFRQRLMDELDDDTPALAQAIGADYYNRLVSEGREDELVLLGGGTVGARFLMPALTLLPNVEVGSLVEDVVHGRRFAHLAEDVESSLKSGLLAKVIEFPAEWLRARVEAGETFWLLLLAAEGDEANLPLLYEHIEALPMHRQVGLIALEPDPGFLPLLREAHAETMLAPMCQGCEGAPEFDELRDLTRALVGMDRPESIELFDELQEVVPEHMRIKLARVASLSAAESIQGRALKLRLLQQHLELNLSLAKLSQFDEVDSIELDLAVELRIERWMDEVIGEDNDHETGSFRYCQSLGMLLYAHARDLFDQWEELAETAHASQGGAGQSDECNFKLSLAVIEGGTEQGLQALLDFWEAIAAGVDAYILLAQGITDADLPERDALRQGLLAYLNDTEIWTDMPERSRNRLLGK